MISSVFIILEVGGLKTYRGKVRSVWIYYEDAIFELEKVLGAKKVEEAKGFVYTNGKKYFRLLEKDLYVHRENRSYR